MSASTSASSASCTRRAAAPARSWCRASTSDTGASASTARAEWPRRNSARGLLLAALLLPGAHAEDEFDFGSAGSVNEGSLHFLDTTPPRAPHHHQNHLRIDADSLASGWVHLAQCHDHLDAVPRSQIVFGDGSIRHLQVDGFAGIESVWIEGSTVQLAGVGRGARLCLSGQTRALHVHGNGVFELRSGPYLRSFLDGYYPMRITLQIEYPSALLSVVDLTPPPQPGLEVTSGPSELRLEALFEGELTVRVGFRRK